MTLASTKGYRREPFPFQGATEADFERALMAAAQRSVASMEDLERATRGCARELKSAGVTPEGVIITMRAYLRHVMETRIFSKRPDNLHTMLEGLCDRLAAWCLDEYFPSHNERAQLVERRP
jgi:hypothetical protein